MNDYMPDDVSASQERRLKPGEICVSGQREVRFTTRDLGSSVAVGVYDPQAHVIGLAHVLFAATEREAGRSKQSLEQNPGLFADTAIRELFEGMEQLGSRIEDGVCIVSLVGAAAMLGEMLPFANGASVLEAVREQLSAYGVVPAVEEVHGTRMRSLSISGENGDMCVGVNGKQLKLV